jgi:general L-amino acid transport system permease protein
MTTSGVSERPPFYRDVRVLKWVYQLVVFAIVAAIVLWLWGNFTRNTEASGIPTSFDFLSNPATFTIPGADFSANEPVRNAYIVGLINTLSVSVVGIILATVLGTLIGIGRLSRNWVVSRLSATYVELFRNVPLLVLLTFMFLGVVLQFMPPIAEAWTPLGWFVVSNRGIGVPWYVDVSGWSLVLVLTIGLVGWWLIARWRQRVFERTGQPSRAGVLGGAVDGRQLAGGIRVDPSFFALLLALVIYTASHIAEIVRGSIQAVPKGQGEAATALALSGFQRMWKVILPQAMRIAIPPLGNQYLSLIKNSSLGAGFSYFDITNVTQITVGNASPAVPAFFLALVFYVIISLVTSAMVNLANRRFKLVER